MAETSKNKIYYNDDENSIADILADMKKLAESTDNAIETKVDKVSGKKLSTNDFTNEYRNKLNELNNYDDTKIKEELEEVKEENTRLKEDLNALPTVSGSGEYVTLDTAECRFKKFSAEGKSEQETTEGYNLCNIPNQTINGVTIINSNNGLILNGTCSSTFSIVALKQKVEAGDYIIKKLGDGASKTTYQSVIYKNNNIVAYVTKTNKSITFENDDEIRLQLYIYSGTVFNNLILPVQVCKDNDRPYEPYTGGIPSPNTKYPSKIRNVGEAINLFDIEELIKLSDDYSEVENGYTFSVNRVMYDTGVPLTTPISLPASISYTVKNGTNTNFRLKFWFDDGTLMSLNNYKSGEDTEEHNFVINNFTKSGAKKIIKIGCDYSKVGTFTLTNFMINEGPSVKKYTPYGQGNINIKIQNENLFDESFFTDNGFLKNEDYYYGNATNLLRYKNFPNSFEKNTQYIISFNAYDTTITTGRGLFFEVKYTDSSKYDININSSSAKDYMYISDSNKTIDCITCLTGGFGSETYIKNFSIIKGLTAKTYVEHKEQNISFSLDKPLYESCYLADDGIHYKKIQIELDGTTDGLKVINVTKHSNDIYYCVVPTAKKGINGVNNLYCSHFKAAFGVEIGQCYVIGAGSGIIFILNDQTITTPKAANDWLAEQKEAGNPVTIEYELATEEIVPYTEEQKQQWEQLKNARSYEGQTHILSTDEISPNFNITARANLSEILNKLQGE